MLKARKQINRPAGPKKPENKAKKDYNIWYNKYCGERHKPGEGRSKASSRCIIATDAGETRGIHNDMAGICLNFARGCCPLGYECSWRHILPEMGKYSLDTMKDCFGRERHEDVRDDQSGVGSFTADDETSRTLYVGGIVKTPIMHSIVYKHFKEWGDIDNIRILDNKGVAFVRYKDRANAEFAMEAMQRQSLDNNEILNIQWASKDPNPWAEKRKEQNAKRKLAEAANNVGVISEDKTDAPIMKKDCLGLHEVTGYYPNTDSLYEDISGNSITSSTTLPSIAPSPPKTLSDLVAWSHKQAHIDKMDDKKNEMNTVKTLVDDYGSSSNED